MNEKELNLLNNFTYGNYTFDDLDNQSYNYGYYVEAMNTLKMYDIDRLNYDEILDKIENTEYIKVFIDLMKNIKRDELYISDGHGINHNIRVGIFALVISVFEKVPIDDFRLIIEGCKYHDIGRINDYEDDEHGLRGAKKLNFLDSKYSSDEINYIKTIITCHSLDDKKFDEVAKKNGIKDIERCRTMLKVLKDSDGLDRTRLSYPVVKLKYMRYRTSPRLIPFSFELYSNYEQNLEKEENKKQVKKIKEVL